MNGAIPRIVLGSRSPQRRELLSLLVPADSIEVRPPHNAGEAGFDGLFTWKEIMDRLCAIARAKQVDVLAQLQDLSGAAAASRRIILTADTVIVLNDSGRPVVLGQPPETEDWKETVREWFCRYYFDRTHIAMSCIDVGEGGENFDRIVQTEITFGPRDDSLLDWYLHTGEPRGKAGGYALQGAAGMFVESVRGSLSNVMGLPLRETRELLSIVES